MKIELSSLSFNLFFPLVQYAKHIFFIKYKGWLAIARPKVEFVNAVTAGGSVKFLPAV